MIAIGRVIERAFFVNDADAGFMRANGDFPDVGFGLAEFFQFTVNRHRRFHCCLRMEFSGEGNLEQHVFHHVRAVGALEFECVAFEQHIIESPCLR